MKNININEGRLFAGICEDDRSAVTLPGIAISTLLLVAGCTGGDSGETPAQGSANEVTVPVATTTAPAVEPPVQISSQLEEPIAPPLAQTPVATSTPTQQENVNTVVETTAGNVAPTQQSSVGNPSVDANVTAPVTPAIEEPAEEIVAVENNTPSIPVSTTSLVATGSDLAEYVPSFPPVASRAAAPAQPVTVLPVLTESSPPAAPVTEFPDGFDFSTNSAPYFENLNTTVVFAGQTMELRIVPRDADGNIPGLFTGPLPDGARFRDNFDGTKSIVWSPLEPDVGVLHLSVTAVDAVAPLYRTTQQVRVHVKLPDDLSTIRNLPPAIDLVRPHRARAGDTVTILVKGTDQNGHVPFLEVLTPRNDSTFEVLEEDDRIRVFRVSNSLTPMHFCDPALVCVHWQNHAIST